MSNEPKVLSPKELADQLFDGAFAQAQGKHREAAQQVISFLKEALVYAMSSMSGEDAAARQMIIFLKEALVYAVAATAGDDAAKKDLLKSVGESIVALTVPQTP